PGCAGSGRDRLRPRWKIPWCGAGTRLRRVYHAAPAGARAPGRIGRGDWNLARVAPYTRAMSDSPAPPPAVPPRPSSSPPARAREALAAAAACLLDLVRHLSGPDGCPWDREQTLTTLSPYIVEEAHEVADAIAERDVAATTEELGDLLFLTF